MTVRAGSRGPAVITVYADSPAKHGGLTPRRRDHARSTATRCRARRSDESTTRIKGPAGTSVTLTLRHHGTDADREAQARSRSTIPVVQS